MKATKEEIIATAKKIIEQIWRNEKIIESTIEVYETKVKIYGFGGKGYYEHDGWFFRAKQYNFPEDSILIFFLIDGTPIYGDYLVTDASTRPRYIIKDSDGNYKRLLKVEDYLKYHNFDFTKKEFEFKKFNF